MLVLSVEHGFKVRVRLGLGLGLQLGFERFGLVFRGIRVRVTDKAKGFSVRVLGVRVLGLRVCYLVP